VMDVDCWKVIVIIVVHEPLPLVHGSARTRFYGQKPSEKSIVRATVGGRRLRSSRSKCVRAFPRGPNHAYRPASGRGVERL
jgi:hypothetical protein